MPDVTNPVLTFRVRLPRRLHVRCVVWENVAALRANTPDEPKKDYAAIFVPAVAGSCVGTINLALTDLRNGTRAHEISHAVDEFAGRVMNELRAQTTEALTNEMDRALSGAGLL